MRSRRRFLFGAALVGGAYIAYTVYRQQRQLQRAETERERRHEANVEGGAEHAVRREAEQEELGALARRIAEDTGGERRGPQPEERQRRKNLRAAQADAAARHQDRSEQAQRRSRRAQGKGGADGGRRGRRIAGAEVGGARVGAVECEFVEQVSQGELLKAGPSGAQRRRTTVQKQPKS